MYKALLLVILVVAAVAGVMFWTPISNTLAQMDVPFFDLEPDMPSDEELGKKPTDKEREEYLIRRHEAYAVLRGVDGETPVDPQMRISAVKELEKDQERLARLPESNFKNALLADWVPIGPAPLFAGSFEYSGRTTAIAIHPTNPDLVYVGTAQGGVYRTSNGGTTWTPIMDSAMSLAIGSIAIAPSNPEIVYVGTGEPNFSADSFFGVGVYRIENASTTATLNGPLNRNELGADVMTGRSVSEIIVNPTDANSIFVSTSSGVAGSGGTAYTPLPARGIFRSTNAASAAPVFTKLTGLANNMDVSVRDIAIDPTNPNILVAGLVSAIAPGIFRSADALSANPTFTQVVSYAPATTTSELTTEFASIHPAGAGDAIFYAATGNLGGRVLRSTDGGVTWTQRIDNDFCSPQCFYDIAVAVDPVNPDQVYLGGSPNAVAEFSTNGGLNFTEGGSGVHVDTHALAVSPSNPTIVYLGTDGGIYRSNNSGASYTELNTSQFSATQFTGLAVHPTDPNFTIGGTQDNGTNYLNPAASSWNRVDGADGGNAIIDTNATDTTNVRMYHTRQNQIGGMVGYRTRATTSAAYTVRGCPGAAPNNGINCNDTTVLFYAPFEAGPGNPNTIYYATDRVYRSADTGQTHTVVSQAPIASGIAVSSIGISPQNDNIRIFGLRNGALWGTTTGSSTLVDLDPTNAVPAGFISRTVIDPNNSNTAYVTIANYAVNNVFKTTNLNAGPPTWANISGTLPRVPVSGFLIDPANSNILYAGTDIGVYVSGDGGTTWNAFGTGFPRVAVFDIAKAGGNTIRIATHGRGMWQIPAFSPTALPVTIAGRVTTPSGQGLRNAVVTMTDTAGVRRVATTSSFGLYSFANVAIGENLIIGVSSKRYRFAPQNLAVTAAVSNLDFVGQE